MIAPSVFSNFYFLILHHNPINEEFVNKEINKIGIKKATGKDGISSKILKLSKSAVAKLISKIINKSLTYKE